MRLRFRGALVILCSLILVLPKTVSIFSYISMYELLVYVLRISPFILHSAGWCFGVMFALKRIELIRNRALNHA
jgi:hypothetical protein